MSKAAKKRVHDKKMKLKRAAKAAKRSQYAALAGTSKRRKRVTRHQSEISGINKHAHVMSNCGNIGCLKCFPELHYWRQPMWAA